MLTSQYVRLTPDERSKEGSIWNHQVSLPLTAGRTDGSLTRQALPPQQPSLVYTHGDFVLPILWPGHTRRERKRERIPVV